MNGCVYEGEQASEQATKHGVWAVPEDEDGQTEAAGGSKHQAEAKIADMVRCPRVACSQLIRHPAMHFIILTASNIVMHGIRTQNHSPGKIPTLVPKQAEF